MTTTRTEIGAPTQDAEREEPAGATAVGAEVPPPHPSSRQLGLPWPRHRGALTTVLSLLLTLVVLGHAWIPNTFGHLGSLVETLLPWTALGIPALLAPAVLRKSLVAVVAVALLTAGWLAAFGGTLAAKSSPGGDLTVVSHNVNQDNPDPRGTVRSLIASKADVLALEELSPDTAPVYERALAASYPYHFYEGTVGLWSSFPLRDARALPIMPWTRALRATVETPKGPLAVYVAHLPSVRVGPAGFTTRARNEALGLLAADMQAERVQRTVLVGDFNGSTGDRALHPLTSRMNSAQSTAGDGFGFTWPSGFPFVRIDQILVEGVKATSAWNLPATTSDHIPVAARIDLDPDVAADGRRG